MSTLPVVEEEAEEALGRRSPLVYLLHGNTTDAICMSPVHPSVVSSTELISLYDE